MKTETTQTERISAMLDGELSDAQLAVTLAGLSDVDNQDGRKTWEIYHQIGDVLRSDELAMDVSPDFSARFSALLEREPAILAPRPQVAAGSSATTQQLGLRKSHFARYAAMGSVAAAAAFAFFMAPQILPRQGDQPDSGMAISRLEQAGKAQSGGVQLASDSSAPVIQQSASEHPDMLRDPRLDSYLLAHQKFSPAIGNGTQYVTHANAVSASSSASEK